MSEKSMSISVVIPHLNQPEMLERCLASLRAGRCPPDEILVVDNGSIELPVAICAAFAGVQLLAERTPGPGPARNRGIAASSGDVLAFIDADCLADPSWLHAAMAELSDPSADILGGDVRISVKDREQLTEIEAYESIYSFRMKRYIEKQNFTGTGNMVVRREVFDRVGLFAGLTVAEDRDWGQRATSAGYRIRYAAEMIVYHPARSSFPEMFSKIDRHMAHDYVRSSSQSGGKLRFAVKALVMALSPVAEIPRILASDRVEGAGNRWRAFVGLTRIRLYRARRMAWLVLGGDPAKLSGAWNRG